MKISAKCWLSLLTSFFPLTPQVAADEVQPLTDATRNRCVSVLRNVLQADDFWPSIHAAEGLTLGGHGAEVIQFLTQKLAKEKDDQRRCGIARELVRAGARNHVAVMLSILSGEDPHGHVHAAESLLKVAEIGDGRDMRRAFQQENNIRLKLMAAAALARCGSPSALTYVRDSLKNPDPDVLKISGWILGRLGDTSDIPRLKAQLKRCEDPVLRAFLDHSLATLGDTDGLQSLTRNLNHTEAAIRTYAATFCGDARAQGVSETLIRMLDDSHPDAACRAAQSLLVLARPAPADANEDVSTLVFAATSESPRYTEGSILALQDGSLLFAATEFTNGGSDFAKAHIVGRTSVDGGRTWTDSRTLQKNTGVMNVMSVTLRRLRNGSVGMFYLQKNSHSDLDLFVRFSMDEAASFGPATKVTNSDGYHVVNNDRITELSTGRLLAPAASTPDVSRVNHFVSHCWISDDSGATWREGRGHVDAPKRGAMEPEVIELNDGRILMIMRTQLGHIGQSVSEDGGETWSPMKPLGIRAPEAPATLRRVPATGDLLLIWNDTYSVGADHGGKRTPLTAAISRDEGRTWKVAGNLETNPILTFSYTSLTFVQDRAVMSYWESGDSNGRLSCRFRSLPVAWFYE